MLFGLNPLLVVILAFLVAFLLGYFIRQLIALQRVSSAENKAQSVLNESKSKAQDIVIEAKDKALKILEEAKKEEKERHDQGMRIENLLTKKETDLEERAKEVKQEKEALKQKAQELANIKTELIQAQEKGVSELERISSLGREKAKEELLAKIEDEYKEELVQKIKKLANENRLELEKQAREILTLAIQRYASSQIADAMTTVVTLPSDEVKGKIIGKEGRNIKAIERLTGVDIIIDDTPEALVVSGFDPVRRQIAKLAIDKLIADGRIHPAKIEEMV